MKNYKNECFADDMNKCFEHDMNEWYNNEYYVLQWYDTSYAGCWRDKNRYQTLKEAQEYINILYRPWLLTPGVLIFIAVLSFNLIGDTIRDILDPKSKMR